MKPEGDPMKIKSEVFEEKTSQENLVEASNRRSEIDSTMLTGADAERFILDRKAEIENIERPEKRFEEYMNLWRTSKKYGQKELAKEIHELAHAAEREFMADEDMRTAYSSQKIKTLINKHKEIDNK